MADLTGQTIAGFEIISKIGQGGMGAVYKARQPMLNRVVAFKVMSNDLAEDREFIERFKREAATAAQFKHPNIVRIYAAGHSNGIHYMAMEFVEGRTLRDHIRSHGRLDPQEAIAITLHVAEGLKYAWNKSRMIHRDIKPDNIFLSKSNEVLVGDLGLAKTAGGGSTELTTSGAMMGSPHYISPEQAIAAKDLDFRTDIYSLGCTLFHMLTGRTPYDGHSSLEIVMKHVNEPPPPILEVWPQCPEALGRLVSKMLAKNRAERHQSYEELITDLFAAAETVAYPQSASTAVVASSRVGACEPTQRVSQAPVTPSTVRAATPKRKSPTTVYAMAGVAVAVMVGGLLMWSPWKAPSDSSAGFESLFNGKDLAGWEGRPEFWSVQDGAIYGKITKETSAKQETFLVCMAGEFGDFELRAHFKLAAGDEKGVANSGIQYRSRIVDKEHFKLSGYQADLVFGVVGQKKTGTLWEQGGRGLLADFGQRVTLREGESPNSPQKVVESTVSATDILASYNQDDWNDLIIIASGNHLRHYLNGKLVVDVTDETAAAARAGTIALQLVRVPMQVWFKDLLVRKITPGAQPTAPSLQHSISSAAALKQLGNVFINSVGAEMVYIPPGEFMMGSTKEEQAWAVANNMKKDMQKHEGEVPRKATIKQGFWMGRTEVTVGQWKQFVKETGYVTDGEQYGGSYVIRGPGSPNTLVYMQGKSWRDSNLGFESQDNHPVCCVSWNDALAFCKWLGNREQRLGRLAHSYVVRLPTEAEWEYACRAQTQTKYWWGDSEEDAQGRLNWGGSKDGFELLAPVDTFGARGRNRFGLADMLGSVWEWCLDEYDPTHAHEGRWLGNLGARVVRGGSFRSPLSSCRSAFRPCENPSSSRGQLGFRIVVGVDASNAIDSTLLTASATASQEGKILAPPETRVPAMTTNPKAGEAFVLAIGSNITMELMGIPPGDFMQGSTKEEQAWVLASGRKDEEVRREGEAPRKAAIKQGFWMGRTEVTVGQWKLFVKETGYVTDGEKDSESNTPQGTGKPWAPKNGVSWRNPNSGFEIRDDHPVSCISWNDAMAFCEWLDKHQQRAGRLAQGYAMRLPTEAEWEYACRAGTQTKFWWGDSEEDGKGRLNWFGKEDGFEFVAPVESYGARGRNRFGLADMLGNIYEWCLDEYDVTQAHADLWTGSPGGRVLRGGSLYCSPALARAAARFGVERRFSRDFPGFRICYGIDVSGAKTTTTSPSHPVASNETGILAPPETRVSALTTNPRTGEVCTLTLGSNVMMELMGIPPGEFMLGSTKEEQAWAAANGLEAIYMKREGEAPRKATMKQGFWMGRTEVTVGQWKQFVKETSYVTDGEKNGASFVRPHDGKPWVPKKGASWRNPDFGFELRDDHPVSCISWNDAVAFCEWMTKHERKAGRLTQGCAMRLPTEAEWEYACRAGRQTKFWWGERMEDGRSRLNWSRNQDGFELVAPVDSYGARGRNGLGLADMLGNVYEWCLDEYDEKQAHYDLWTGNADTRMLRGGSFWFAPGTCRCAHRRCNKPSVSICDYGFRVMVGVSGAKTTTASPSPTAAPKEGGILASPETRVPALTTNPKVGEVFTLNIATNVTMELMGIPPGEFMQGSTKEEQAWANANGCDPKFTKLEGEAPRKATIKQGFWMGRTEVTVKQWKRFVKETGYVTDGEKQGESYVRQEAVKGWAPKKGVNWRNPNFAFELQDNHPVSCISWNDAKVFCEWLSDQELKAGRLPLGCKVRLPTEAEWEYACRAGAQTKFWWGESTEDGTGRLNSTGKKDGFEFVAPVDSLGARGRNRFGLADILGNVHEWCLDECDATQANENLWTGNPSKRLVRGGSYSSPWHLCRCARRTSYVPAYSTADNGFRVVVGVNLSAAATTTPSTSPAATPKEAGVLAPPETRITMLTANPKVGEVFTLNVGSNVTMELMGIPPGEFMMGNTKEERAWAVANGLPKDWAVREGESPHKEAIKQGFWMARTEVTVGQWKQFASATGYVTDGEKAGESFGPRRTGKSLGSEKGMSWREPKFYLLADNQPVICISRNDAMAFCKWLTDRELKAGRLPPGFVLRLPAEAEWEYACRAGTQSKFWWGENTEDGKGRLNWHEEGSKFEWVFPVDSFGLRGRNRFGLADMLGNVYEWCLGEYDAIQARDELMVKFPAMTAITRGASYHNGPDKCRCAYRYVHRPDASGSWNGFRVCVGVTR